MSLANMIKKTFRTVACEKGALTVMYALLLPLLAALLSLTLDGSNLLTKKARLADIVTESLVSSSTHSYSQQVRSTNVLKANLAYHFPQDTVLTSWAKVTVTESQSGYKYDQIAAARLNTTAYLPLVVFGFDQKQAVAYQSPVYKQSTSKGAITFSDQTGLVDTGVGIDSNGKLWVWGYRDHGLQGNGANGISGNADTAKPAMVVIPPGQSNSTLRISKIAGGIYHLIALDENGDVWSWGQDLYGEAGSTVCNGSKVLYNPTPCKVLSGVVDIASGEYTTLMQKADGTLWFLGECRYNQCGNNRYATTAPEADLTRTIPTQIVLGNEKVTLIGAAYEGNFAVTVNGSNEYSVWGFGDNEGCGLGFTQYVHSGTGPIATRNDVRGGQSKCHYGYQDYRGLSALPRKISGLKNYADKIVYIAGGNGWGTALLDDGSVIGWGTHFHLGQNYPGSQYESAALTNLEVAPPIVIMQNIKTLQSRYIGNAALTQDNMLYTWGGHQLYQVYGSGVTFRAADVKEFAVGKEHMFYTNMDGQTFGVGYLGASGDKFLLGNFTQYLTHPLNGMIYGLGDVYTVNWPGIELDFSKYGIDLGNNGYPEPMP
ncbi:Cell cycle control protein [Yersinia similis]|nr:Cell cycle control protein [Yersinia similis]CNF56525.1 Cell cycle control protein [Yersinia similis]